MERKPGEDERTAPLLEPRPVDAAGVSSNKQENQDAEEEEVASLGRRLVEENKKLWVVAAPSICARFATFGVTVISQAFIGHIGPTELAGYAIVSTVLMRLSTGILLGMASALETLCGQSYGAKQYHMLGIYLQRSWIILFCCAVLLTPIYLFTTPLLIALGQDPQISAMAGTISLWYIPVMFSLVWSFTLQMYLQSQSKNMIVTYLALLNLGLHLFMSWLLTVKFHFGLVGVLSSMVIAYWIPVFGQLAFVFFGGCPLTWTGFSSAALTNLSAIIKLSLSSGVMLCVEMWYNTVLVLLTGYMKNAEIALDALSICLNINGWEMMISIGFLAATGVRVANELGAGSARRAKFAIFNVVTTSFLIGFVLFVLFLIFRGSLAYIFTESKAVANAVADLSPLLAFSILLNSVQPVLSGVAIGSGWQSVVAYVNLASYYLIGIPIGAMLGYVIGFQVKGIWIGMLLGTLVQTLVLIFITFRTDWEKQVEIARARVNRWCMDENGTRQNSRGSPGGVHAAEDGEREIERRSNGLSTSKMERPGDDERTAPLLEPKPVTTNGAGDSNKQEENAEEIGSLGRRLVEENKKLWVVAAPSICARFASFGVTVISLAFIVHIGPTELAGFAIVSTVLMRFSTGILLGMASALETLCGQSYGAKQYHIVEIWYNTVLVLLTGYMKNAEIALDALSICLNINGWEMMISIGFLGATGVRVANELGARSARRAKFAIFNVVTTSFLIGFMLFVLFLIFRGSLAYIFTESKAVADAVVDLSPLLAFSILLNSVQPVLSGVAVGCGWQSVVAYVNVTSYYLIGIPIDAILGYVIGFQVKGIWIGMLIGTLVQTLVLLFITLRTDWEKQVEIARERLNQWVLIVDNAILQRPQAVVMGR
uniref:Protein DETOXIFICATION n=1 Tax=Leersia perrieri TaxID=77586 RepID=A0A0D9XNM0_9ORYZ